MPSCGHCLPCPGAFNLALLVVTGLNAHTYSDHFPGSLFVVSADAACGVHTGLFVVLQGQRQQRPVCGVFFMAPVMSSPLQTACAEDARNSGCPEDLLIQRIVWRGCELSACGVRHCEIS